MADADLPSLSHGHLVGHSMGPTWRGKRVSAVAPRHSFSSGAPNGLEIGALRVTASDGRKYRGGTKRGLRDGGHENLPVGGHRISPLVATGSPHWWPSDLPIGLS
jgi:hypothetical protein